MQTASSTAFSRSSELKLCAMSFQKGWKSRPADTFICTNEGAALRSILRDIEAAGLGNLSVAFEKLTAELEAEGIFDAARKKPIPFFPEKIAVITSETGAAIRDILKIIKSKNHYTDVLIYPVLVQGPAAAGQISQKPSIRSTAFFRKRILSS